MRVCLVRCPSAFLIDERAFPPLGLLAVGAGLRQQGHDVTVFDGDLADLPLDFAYYGFGPTAPEYPVALQQLHRIKQHNPQARVIVGGPHVTLNYTQCHDGWDCVVVGDGELEAERAFLGPVQRIFAESLPLDRYPAPDRSLIDLRNYTFTLHGRPATTIVSSRGCPFRCAFCCKNHNHVRLRSAQKLISEIREVSEFYGYRAIAFPEDIFTLNQTRTKLACDYLQTTDILWRCLLRADLVVRYGPAYLDMMVAAGCVGVGIGVESGSDMILNTVQKGETTATIKQAIRMIKAAGIYVKGYFIVGLPGESPETLIETDQFLEEVQLDGIDCKIYQPYPGSPIVDNKSQYDIQWDEVPLEGTYYKGLPGVYHGNVRTSRLTTQQIYDAWVYFEQTYGHVQQVESNVNG